MGKAHLTAIARKAPSKPMRWLDKHGLLKGNMLDYGCGRGKDAETFGMDKYDPHYCPVVPVKQYDTIVCTFVLNVIEDEVERESVLQSIRNLLVEDGTAYVTVRNDKRALNGTTSTGTWQGHIVLDLPIVYECAGFVIYEVTNG